MNYTVFVDGPLKAHPFKVFQNCAGQSLVWDGPAKRRDIFAFCMRAAEYFERVQGFAGKDLGKLIFSKSRPFHRHVEDTGRSRWETECQQCHKLFAFETMDEYCQACRAKTL